MKSKLLHDDGEKTFMLVFQEGDQVMKGLVHFAKENRLTAARFTAIGAFQDVTLAFFRVEERDYKHIPVDEQVEVLNMTGDITLGENREPKVHAHVIAGLPDGSTRGGHLIEGTVRPTLEVMLIESPSHLARAFDPASGLALIDPSS